MSIAFSPIGIIHSPFTSLHSMPIQPTAKAAAPGTVELYPEFEEGLQDLDGFSHIMLFYHFHCSSGFELTVTPYLDTVKRGLFATRAPRRPNPIGLSVVRLTAIEGPLLRVANLDILDGTPLLDIKPYVPEYHTAEPVRTGWISETSGAVRTALSDSRFSEPA